MANEAFDIIVSSLKRNPQATFASIRDKAAAKGHTIYPVSYGRAKALLGLVKSKPRKDAKTATEAVAPHERAERDIQKAVRAKFTPIPIGQRLNALGQMKAIANELNALRRFKAKVTALLTTCD